MQACLKRLFDLVWTSLGLLCLSPLLGLIALGVKLGDGGPVFYRQTRVGRDGRIFRIWKFRTMVVGADQMGPGLTQKGDRRITSVGRLLRRSKLDELPQLFNVLSGQMSLVGPRPELPRYVARYTPEQRQVLHCKPGITDQASLLFRHEEQLLEGAKDVEDFYLRYCLPKKIAVNRQYAQHATVLTDLALVLRTLWVLIMETLRDFCSPRNAVRDNAPSGGRPRQGVAIIGAGSSARRLAADLNGPGGVQPQVVAFFDDDPRTWNKWPHGIPVVGMPECLLNPKWQNQVNEVIVALPSDRGPRLQELSQLLGSLPFRLRIASDWEQHTTGSMEVRG